MIIIQASRVLSVVHWTLVARPWASQDVMAAVERPRTLATTDEQIEDYIGYHAMATGLRRLITAAQEELGGAYEQTWEDVL